MVGLAGALAGEFFHFGSGIGSEVRDQAIPEDEEGQDGDDVGQEELAPGDRADGGGEDESEQGNEHGGEDSCGVAAGGLEDGDGLAGVDGGLQDVARIGRPEVMESSEHGAHAGKGGRNRTRVDGLGPVEDSWLGVGVGWEVEVGEGDRGGAASLAQGFGDERHGAGGARAEVEDGCRSSLLEDLFDFGRPLAG